MTILYTANRNYPYPNSAELAINGATAMGNLAVAIDTDINTLAATVAANTAAIAAAATVGMIIALGGD